jgi:AraC family transcriptional regulator of adaptative response/methylated-DNA-[protein]-cysteine methyltransferase
MHESESLNFKRISEAIAFIQENFQSQPSLEQIAEKIHLSPSHFQRIFSEWAGISPKKFMQYLSVGYAKELLRHRERTLFDIADEIGLSGTGRLHDLFVKIEGMTPGEYKNGGDNLSIEYSYSESPFGELIVASTAKGICHLSFIEDITEGLKTLKSRFPKARYLEAKSQVHRDALSFFRIGLGNSKELKLHLKGTDFQLNVWEALLKIPQGELTTYGAIAQKINKPSASRAIGTAIGSNPIAFLIPCHRVIQTSGNLGGYMWGVTRKSAIIGWEAAKVKGE